MNVKCQDLGVVSDLAPSLTGSFVVYLPEIIEMLIDDLLVEEVEVLNALEERTQKMEDLYLKTSKKNRMVNQGGLNRGVLDLVEALEEYKGDLY